MALCRGVGTSQHPRRRRHGRHDRRPRRRPRLRRRRRQQPPELSLQKQGWAVQVDPRLTRLVTTGGHGEGLVPPYTRGSVPLSHGFSPSA